MLNTLFFTHFLPIGALFAINALWENLVTHAGCVYLFSLFLFVAANAIDNSE